MNRADLLQAPRGCWVGLAAVLLLAGCGKVPTWNELTNQSSPSTPNQPANVVTSPPLVQKAETPLPTKTPLEVAEETIANFKKLPPGAVTNEAIASLTSLPEGAD